jgi:hypothetical protein
MRDMNRTAATSNDWIPRRFILLPEEPSGGSAPGGRIRRYKLSSLGSGAGRGRSRSGAVIPSAADWRGAGRAGP